MTAWARAWLLLCWREQHEHDRMVLESVGLKQGPDPYEDMDWPPVTPIGEGHRKPGRAAPEGSERKDEAHERQQPYRVD